MDVRQTITEKLTELIRWWNAGAPHTSFKECICVWHEGSADSESCRLWGGGNNVHSINSAKPTERRWFSQPTVDEVR